MALTWPASSTPERASRVTLAGCPSLILEISDSEKATVMVIAWVLTISTRPVLLDDELLLEPPRLPAVDPVLAVEPVLLPVEPELDPVLELEPPEIWSPGETSSTLTTVPPAGA